MKTASIHTVIFLWILTFISCGIPQLQWGGDLQDDLYVKTINPQNGSSINQVETIDIEFSAQVLPSSVLSEHVFLLTKEVFDSYQDDWDELYDDIVDVEILPVQTQLELLQDQKLLRMTVNESLQEQTQYVVVVLPKVLSKKYYPLNQTVVGEVRSFFRSHFTKLGENSSSQSVSENKSSHQAESENGSSSQNHSEESSGVEEENAEEQEQSLTPEEIEQIVTEFSFNKVVITEVSTDPQSDHNESEGGNGVLFDTEFDSGNVTTSDEFIEIFNGTDQVLDISLWSLKMTDDNSEQQDLNDSWEYYFSQGGSLEEFQPGEVLVLGNPRGSLNNSIVLELYNDEEELVDSLEIEDATSDDVSNESYFFDKTTAEWTQGEASPGVF